MMDKIKTVLFTVLVTAAFTLLVSGVNSALSARIAANKLISKQKVILNLFGFASETANISEEEIPNFYAKMVGSASDTQKMFPKFDPAKAEGYVLKDSSNKIIVCSFTGQGFWDVIKGFMAIDTQKKEIKGIEFTQHGETPGLGGRISEPEFKARFVNKPFGKIRTDGLRLNFVPEGSAKKADEVDGITGATGTTSAMEKIVNKALNEIMKITEGGAEH